MNENETTTITTQAESQEVTARIETARAELMTAIQEPSLSNSIKPSIAECERFIVFLNERLNCGLNTNDLTILIQQTHKNTKGHFKPKEHGESIQAVKGEKAEPINEITLSSYHLTATPYETIAHELAHYINHKNGIKDCSTNQYHNKKFKAQAELLLLAVEKDSKRGYAYTKATPQFLELLKEFEPNNEAFKIYQAIGEKEQKGKSRLLLFECECGCKIRTARNQEKPLKAVCQYCQTEFQEVTD